LTLISPITIWC